MSGPLPFQSSDDLLPSCQDSESSVIVRASEITGLGLDRHWPAMLTLGFDSAKQGDSQRTRMHQMQFKGPLRVQRPFYPEDGACHVYLLHPPGGLVSGDDLAIQVECQPDAHALLTTPSAGKIYHADTDGVVQRQTTAITVTDARCEWLPMETIVFDGAHGVLKTAIQLHGNAKFIGMDVVCLGRPASALPFSTGVIEQHLSLYHNGVPLLLERQRLSGNDPLLYAKAGFQQATVSGTLLAFAGENICDERAAEFSLEMLVEKLRDALPQRDGDDWFSVTERLGVIVVRYLGHNSERAQQGLRQAWQILRPDVIGTAPVIPRVWNT
ncbi:urease accessory protein UreD [Corallincola platygyrae]|uniref:Urease accessory protein UreD n=1 Tax=Corallincola platygyrae TaxID=1193278 RepID=A0ABW4XHQ2_9GAMM